MILVTISCIFTFCDTSHTLAHFDFLWLWSRCSALLFSMTQDHFALRPQKRGGLLGTGTGGGGGGGRKSEGSTADTARKRPERLWTAARTMEVLRRCPLAIAQRLVHCATAVFNYRALAESQGQCPLHCCRGTTRSERNPTFEAQFHLPTHDLFWANSKVQLDLPPLYLLIF